MRFVRTFAALLAALTVLAFGALAPSDAAAHPGHTHAQGATSSAHDTHAAETAAAKSKRGNQSTWQASIAPLNAAYAAPCTDRGCCGSGSCNACCSAVASAITIEHPPVQHARVPSRQRDAAAAPAPEGPSRPPRTFA